MSKRFLQFVGFAAASLLAACGGGGGSGGDGGGGGGPPPASATISVFAGSLPRAGGVDGPSASAQFNQPEGVAQDSAGNIYIADTGNHTIRKRTPQGAVSTLAGTAGQSGSADGIGGAARFSSPSSVVVDAAGVLYVADRGNHTVRRISVAGAVSTYAGTAGQSGSGDGLGDAARFFNPSDLAIDAGGNLYVGDTGNRTVRRIATDGRVTTFAGTAGVGGQSVKGDGPQAQFATISGVAVDGTGNVYVAEGDQVDPGLGNSRNVRKFNSQGQAAPIGTGADGMVQVPNARGLAVDGAGNLYVPSSGSIVAVCCGGADIITSVAKITPAGVVQILAGVNFSGRFGTGYGSADGPGASARFRDPRGIAVGNNGQVIVADTGNHTIRQIDANGVVSTVAGRASIGLLDGAGAEALFYRLAGIAAQDNGTLYVSDSGNRALRVISPAGVVSTRPLADNRNNVLSSLALDPAGQLYAVNEDTTFGGETVVTVDAQGRSTSYVGGSLGNGGGNAIALDRDTSLYFGAVAAPASGGLVKVTRAGVRSVLTPSASPLALAVEASGVVYVANGDNTVLAVRNNGVVDVLAGQAGQAGFRDGRGAEARFNFGHSAIAVDPRGNVYVAQEFTIRRITPDGVVSTIVGVQGQNETVPGALPGRIGQVRSLAWSNGSLYATVGDAVLRIGPLN